MKEMYPRSEFYHLKVGNSLDIQTTDIPADRYSKLFLNANISRHVHSKYLK